MRVPRVATVFMVAAKSLGQSCVTAMQPIMLACLADRARAIAMLTRMRPIALKGRRQRLADQEQQDGKCELQAGVAACL